MNGARLAGIVLAIALHAGAVYALRDRVFDAAISLDEGSGSSEITVVATVSVESSDIVTQAATPALAPTPENKVDQKDETADLKKEPPEAEPSPPDTAPPLPDPPKEAPQPPREVAVREASQEQEAQVATAALAAKRAKQWTAYQRDLYSAIEKYKKEPRQRLVGDVLVSMTIAPSGELIARSVMKSSGQPELDNTALASLDRAAPFPPLPPDIASGPYTILVPFQFRIH